MNNKQLKWSQMRCCSDYKLIPLGEIHICRNDHSMHQQCEKLLCDVVLFCCCFSSFVATESAKGRQTLVCSIGGATVCILLQLAHVLSLNNVHICSKNKTILPSSMRLQESTFYTCTLSVPSDSLFIKLQIRLIITVPTTYKRTNVLSFPHGNAQRAESILW